MKQRLRRLFPTRLPPASFYYAALGLGVIAMVAVLAGPGDRPNRTPDGTRFTQLSKIQSAAAAYVQHHGLLPAVPECELISDTPLAGYLSQTIAASYRIGVDAAGTSYVIAGTGFSFPSSVRGTIFGCDCSSSFYCVVASIGNHP